MRIHCIIIIAFFWISGIKTVSGSYIPEIIDIGVFSGESIRKFNFTVTHGRYLICNSNHEKLLEITPFSTITLEVNQENFTVIRNDSVLFTESNITLQGSAFYNSFLLNPYNRNLDQRAYDGDLKVSLRRGMFQLINSVPFESYVAGTVQWESGFNHHDIFYQVQAIIIRTYALRNINRHAHEGFHLCDRVHCQAYYGKVTENYIISAVDRSRGEVIVDNTGRLLNTVYHANCGGQTVNSEDLWTEALPYLRSKRDIYCSDMPGSLWQAQIAEKDLRRFLRQRYRYNPSDEEWNGIRGFRQAARRNFLDPGGEVQLRHIREHFGLRSTYFSVKSNGDSLLLTGKGYGHGVGLCQEGAMQRARHGYSRKEILNFYYNNSKIEIWQTELLW